LATSAQDASLLPARTVVKARAYASLEPVPRGRAFEVAVVAEILPGFHINANKVLEDYLIPTRVQAELPAPSTEFIPIPQGGEGLPSTPLRAGRASPAGLRLLETEYPPGQLEKFEFSDKLLLVYDGTVIVRMKLSAPPDTPLGVLHLPLALRYQACNDTTCLPPVTIPIAVELEIAPAGSKARALHPEVFQKSQAGKKR
jgi:hypothetical protein